MRWMIAKYIRRYAVDDCEAQYIRRYAVDGREISRTKERQTPFCKEQLIVFSSRLSD
ncbi:MAG: hypothetical protein PHO37_17765 [Kiritimatiellae bacterium]|nr:hypothetical protein [Kiritimatiellia bacterium]